MSAGIIVDDKIGYDFYALTLAGVHVDFDRIAGLGW
jgi:hypothetical protein